MEGGHSSVQRGQLSIQHIPRLNDTKAYNTLMDFQIVQNLGSGGFGVVQKAHPLRQKYRLVAIKTFTADIQKYNEREIQILQQLTHSNIVTYLGVICDEESKDNGVSQKILRYIGYVMEYMELGSLDKLIHNKSETYGIKLVATWISQIALGLQYLHENDIIHRDVKPQNILLAARNHLKLADFGLARKNSIQNTNSYGEVGTRVYRAPEVNISTNYGAPADVYSFGVTIWEIIHRRKPCEKDMERDRQGNIIKVPNYPHELGVLTDLVKKCLEVKPADRPTLSDIFEYLFNKGFHQTIFIVDTFSSNIAVLNADRSEWIELELQLEIPPSNFYSGAVYLNGEIHMVGCGDEYKSLCKLDRNSLKWIQLADMNVGRRGISNSCLVLDGYIWVLGGFGAGESLKSVERYDPKANKWTLMPEMKYPRAGAAAAVWNNQIIISGGETRRRIIDTVECFNPKDGSWTELPNMPKPLAFHSLVSYKNKIILMSGRDDKRVKQTGVYELDPLEENPAWRSLPPIKYPSHVTAGVVLDDEIYAFKSNASSFSKLVEIFNGQHWRDEPALNQSLPSIHPMIISQHLANRLCNYKSEKKL